MSLKSIKTELVKAGLKREARKIHQIKADGAETFKKLLSRELNMRDDAMNLLSKLDSLIIIAQRYNKESTSSVLKSIQNIMEYEHNITGKLVLAKYLHYLLQDFMLILEEDLSSDEFNDVLETLS